MSIEVRVQTPNAAKIGEVSDFEGVTVVRVGRNDHADVRYERYTADYRQYRARHWIVGRSSYGSLQAAVKAVIKARHG